MKINVNYFGVNIASPIPNDITVSPGETKYLKLLCVAMSNIG